MRRATIILFLIIFAFSLLYISHAVSDEKSVKPKRFNRLEKLYFIPEQNLIVGACSSEPNGSVRFWTINDGKLKETLDFGRGVWAISIAVRNSGNLVVIALLVKNEITCYSLTERKWLWRANWVERGVVGNVIKFNPDDRKVVVVGFANIVTYDAQTGGILQRQEDPKWFTGGFPRWRTRNNAISPSAKYAAFWQGDLEHDEGWWSSRNIWVLVRDIETGKIIAKQGKVQQKYKNCSAAFTPDEKNLVLGSMDGYVRIWSILEQKVIKEWRAYGADEEPVPFRKDPSPNVIDSMTFSPDGRYFATIGDLNGGSAVRIWDYTTNKLIHEFRDVISSPLAMCSGYPMAFSHDGKYFALEQQGRLCLYDTKSWEEKWCVLSWPEDYRVK
jgi:WD40 repeat protein